MSLFMYDHNTHISFLNYFMIDPYETFVTFILVESNFIRTDVNLIIIE